ncbi:MAG: ABC transporter ATP-binding protein [Deltaproteobacteria bacterium]|nr:ABC transporter ATP-binding protein [Deltaproteobacteria bacterium]
MTAIVELRHVSKSYDGKEVIRDLSFVVRKGKTGCLLGPSGCGKTTVLRAIAGFEWIQAGEIYISKALVSSPASLVPPEKRKIGMVFQDYALFPHLKVKDNIAFGLRGKGPVSKEKRTEEMIDLVGLQECRHKYPHELSGGEQQRVALARAMAPDPEILLMDEPFSNLDITLRERLSEEVRDILKASGTTAIFVTHNQNEAFALADEIGVINDGKMLQWDTPYNLYHFPKDRFVAEFVGEGVLLPGRVVDDRRVETALGPLEGDIISPCPKRCPVDVLIRPEDILHDDTSKFKAKVLSRQFRGANIIYELMLPSKDRVLSLVPSYCQHDVGQEIGIIPRVDDIILFEK